MKNNKICLVFCFIVMSCLQALGQKSIIPPSPNAASLGKYGDIPVNLSSGLPSVNIPLYTAKERSINWPISLSYNYSGFKPAEEVSIAGRGWSLNAGGVITRVIRGSWPDEKRLNGPGHEGGYLYSGVKAMEVVDTASGAWKCTSNCPPPAYFSAGNVYDGQPDMFYFSFGSISGKFFFGIDGSPKIVSDQKLKIEYTLVKEKYAGLFIENGMTDNIINWTITATDGTIYKFGFTDINSAALNVEYTYPNDGSTERVINAWHLYEVVANTGEKIIFQYANDFITSGTKSVSKYRETKTVTQSGIGGISGGGASAVSYLLQRSTENLLKRIEGTNFRIDFIPTQYQDGSSSYKLLDSVKVFSKTPGAGLSLVKAYDFGFDSNRNSKLLVSIQEFGSGADRLPFYEFEYYRASQLTNIDGWSLDIDFKNYYNYYDRLHNGTNHNTTLLVDNGANRSPNLESTMLGALTKIKYPTGGYTGFEYESNDFSYVRESPYVGPGGQKKTTAPGLRLRTMTDNDSRGNNVVKTYEYRSFADTTLSSGIAWEELDPYSIGFGAFLQCGHNYGFVIEGLSYCPSRYIEFYRVYKSEPFYALSKDPIYYFNVREKVGGSTLNRTDYTYTSHFDFPDFMGSSYGLSNNRMGSVASKDFARSLPKIIQYYNSEGTLVSEKKMEYVLSNRYKSPGVDIDDILTTRPAGETYVFMKTIYTYSGWLRKVKETVTQY